MRITLLTIDARQEKSLATSYVSVCRRCSSAAAAQIGEPQPQWPIIQIGHAGSGYPPFFGHFLRGRSLKGRCNICVYVPVCVCVCSCVCVCPSCPPHNPAHTVGLNNRIPPAPAHDPSPPFPHPYPQAIARPTLGKNYPLKSARVFQLLHN